MVLYSGLNVIPYSGLTRHLQVNYDLLFHLQLDYLQHPLLCPHYWTLPPTPVHQPSISSQAPVLLFLLRYPPSRLSPPPIPQSVQPSLSVQAPLPWLLLSFSLGTSTLSPPPTSPQLALSLSFL